MILKSCSARLFYERIFEFISNFVIVDAWAHMLVCPCVLLGVALAAALRAHGPINAGVAESGLAALADLAYENPACWATLGETDACAGGCSFRQVDTCIFVFPSLS